jgi:lantibiotic bacteriocin
MSEFDLDARVVEVSAGATPQIKSISLCTPGCITGILHCTTRSCNITGGCSITK